MSQHYESLTDEFEALTMDPGGFRHIDHVGVAYVMLQRYDFLEAMSRFARTINTIATRAGAADKFNLTVTLAFLSLIAERLEQGPYADADDFIAKHPDLVEQNPLTDLYSSERMSSELARRVFLLPDVGRHRV